MWNKHYLGFRSNIILQQALKKKKKEPSDFFHFSVEILEYRPLFRGLLIEREQYYFDLFGEACPEHRRCAVKALSIMLILQLVLH